MTTISPDDLPTAADLLALPDDTKRAMVAHAREKHGPEAARALEENLQLPSPPVAAPAPRPAGPIPLERRAERLESEIAGCPLVEQNAAREAAGRVMARRRPHRPGSRKTEDGQTALAPEFGSYAAHAFRSRDAFGTASDDFATTMLTQLAVVARDSSDEDACGGSETAAMIAAVDGVRPENEVEAMLAVQMAATHATAMRMLGQVSFAKSPAEAQGYGALATKLLRTFPAQVEALSRLRRKGEQTVRVEHVHVYQGGQAIVGAVSAGQPPGDGGRGGAQSKIGHQAHAPSEPAAQSIPARPALLRADAGGDGVPSPRRRGKAKVPDARRSRRERVAGGA